MSDQPSSRPIYRPSMRCVTCSRWWSGEPLNGHVQHCACGGELAPVDMEAHMAGLPVKTDTDEERAELKLQQERAQARANLKGESPT